MQRTRFLPRLMLAALLAGCGQTGALYLPDEGVESPVEVRPATPPAPAPAPTPEPEDEDQDRDQPPGR
jgi:predicted small lipoprotein YifL